MPTEDAYSSGPWSCPTMGLACVLMSRPISPELILSPDFWISNIPRYFSFAYVRREILCMHKNSLSMPTYGPYAASTWCTRYANVPRVQGTVGVRWRNVHSTLTLVDTKCVNFTTSLLRVASEFWTFCARTVAVFSAYAYRIKIDSALVSVFIARSHRMQNERVAYT